MLGKMNHLHGECVIYMDFNLMKMKEVSFKNYIRFRAELPNPVSW